VVGVVLNLAVWFAIHTLFGQVSAVRLGMLRFDAPVVASLDVAALLLAAGAAVAVFRFRVGMIPVLLACAALGAAYRLIA
jgi:chromate transporter